MRSIDELMKTPFQKVFSLTAILLFIFSFNAFAQITSSSSSGRTSSNRTQEVQQTEAVVNQLTDKVGILFKEGMLALKDQRRSDAGEKFNKSVEVFLLSTMNVQSNPRLSACYNQLIETVYRMEFPANQPPNIRSLSASCGWNWNNQDFQLADEVADLVRSSPVQTDAPTNTALITSAEEGTAAQTPDPLQVGFNEQKFEPSPRDELAKLQLTLEEENIDTPEAQQQYQYIQYAVANKSLGFSFQVHPMIQQFLNYYQGRGRKTMETGLYRSGMFMQMARRIFREEGVPENVAWLGQVESMWKPTAMSWASASGLWQFIPGTGSRFGLRRTAYMDERNSFEKATKASAKYLKFLANRYGGNWELAMGAYNCGEGNVDRAVRRAGVANFWAAYPYLPQETRNYVPNILATILIANSPHKYGFGHIRPAPPLRYDQIRVPSSTNLRLLAQASDTSIEYIRYLNPELRSNTTPPEPYIVRVPAGKANEVVALFRKVPASQRDNMMVATAAKGETWESLANKLGFSAQELRELNGNAPVPTGKVFVPNRGNGVTNTTYSRPVYDPAVRPAVNVKIVKAQRTGETVEEVARRHGADPVEVAKFNGLFTNSKLTAGREIKIPTK
ncbi:MAG: transglycosylase SLT domain-containing protein [Pyrinomonadaceae bacterium]